MFKDKANNQYLSMNYSQRPIQRTIEKNKEKQSGRNLQKEKTQQTNKRASNKVLQTVKYMSHSPRQDMNGEKVIPKQ